MILLLLFPSFCSLFSLFSKIKSIPGGCGAFLIRSLAKSFFPTSSSHNSEPTMGFPHQRYKYFEKQALEGFVFSIYFSLWDLIFA